MKKFYEAPELEMIKFHQEEVLNGSVPSLGGGDVESDFGPGTGKLPSVNVWGN